MVKRIYNNGDCIVDLSEFKDIIDAASSLKVVFYVNTTSVNTEKESLTEDYKVILNWNELQPLGRGMLQYILYYGNTDTAFTDGEYNRTDVRTTDYFIMSDIQITDDVTTNVNMSEMLQEQIDRLNKFVVWDIGISELGEETYINDIIKVPVTLDFSAHTYDEFLQCLKSNTKTFYINLISLNLTTKFLFKVSEIHINENENYAYANFTTNTTIGDGQYILLSTLKVYCHNGEFTNGNIISKMITTAIQ